MKLFVKSLGFGLAASCALSVLAAEPWISVPSTPTTDGRLVITGGELGSSATLTLRIEHPAGAVSEHAVVADPAGRLRFEYTLPAPGGYGVEVVDTSGRTVGRGRLGHFR